MSSKHTVYTRDICVCVSFLIPFQKYLNLDKQCSKYNAAVVCFTLFNIFGTNSIFNLFYDRVYLKWTSNFGFVCFADLKNWNRSNATVIEFIQDGFVDSRGTIYRNTWLKSMQVVSFKLKFRIQITKSISHPCRLSTFPSNVAVNALVSEATQNWVLLFAWVADSTSANPNPSVISVSPELTTASDNPINNNNDNHITTRCIEKHLGGMENWINNSLYILKVLKK